MLVAILLCGAGSAWGETKTDVLNQSFTGITGNNYSSWTGKTGTSGAVYAGNSAGGNSSIQLRSNNNNSGIVTTTSGGKAKKVTVVWNNNTSSGRTLNVYGKNSAYSDATDLYNSSNQGTLLGTIVNGTSTELTISGDYEYIGFRSASGAMYLTSVSIVWETGGSTTEKCATPTFSPAAGTFTEAQSVAITCATEGATIHYTTDGTEPTAESTEYTASISVSQTTTIKAIAVAEGYDNSAVASATYAILNHAGTQADPYTVADARAAIDAGTGVTGVYATGIVTAIPTAFNSEYNNITFNFVDESGDQEFLQAYRCGGTEAANVQIGDIVVVCGNLTKHNTTYEFGQGCQLFSLTKATVAQPTFNPTAGAYTEQQSVTIACETEGATIYYTTDGTEPTAESTEYTAPITVSQTTTIKAIAIKGGALSTVASAIYTIQDPNAPGTENNPYTVADAIEFINTLDGAISNYEIYVSGIVSTAPTQNPTSSGQLTYYISDDGTTSTEMEVYRGKGLNGADFSSKDDLKVGDEVTVKGYVKLYKETPEFDTGSILTAFNRPETPAETYAINWNNPEGVTVRVYNAEDASIEYNNGDKVAKNTTIRIDVERPDYITVESLLVQDGTQTIEMANYDNWVYTMLYDHDVTITVVVADSRTVTSMSYSSDGPQWNSVTQTVTISSAEEFVERIIPILVINNGAEIRDEVEYSSSNTDVATIDATGKVTIVGPGTVVITATFAGNNTYQPCDASYTIVFNAPNFAELPFSYDGNGSDELPAGLSQNGIGTYGSSPAMKFDGTGDYVLLAFNEQPGTLTFDIKGNSFSGGTFTVQTSEDGVTFTDLKSYTELTSTVQSEVFDNLGADVRYIKWIYTQKSSGNVGLGNIKLEKYDSRPTVSAGTLTGVTSLELWDGDMENIEVGGRVTPGTTVFVKPVLEADYTLETIEATDAAGSPITLTENSGAWSFTMPETNVTINATATIEPIEGDKFVKVTSTADLTNGQYLIVYEAGKLAFNGALETLDAVGNSIAVKIIQHAVAATNEAKAAAFTIDVTNGTIKSGSGLYIGQTSDANGLATSTEALSNTITLAEDGTIDLLSSGGAFLRYNKESNQTRFRYYKSSSYTGQQPIALYKLVKTGDVNNDGNVTIADVTALVNIILGKDDVEPYKYNHDVADVNDDKHITIADVTALVNIILGK